MAMPGSGVPPWVAPIAIVAIVLGAALALVLALVLDSGFGGEPIHPAIFCGILVLVAVVEIGLTRLIIIPAQFAADRDGGSSERTPRQTIETASVLALAFSVSPSIYGVVVAGFTGEVLYGLPFPFLSLTALGVLMSYVSDRAGELARAVSVNAIS